MMTYGLLGSWAASVSNVEFVTDISYFVLASGLSFLEGLRSLMEARHGHLESLAKILSIQLH